MIYCMEDLINPSCAPQFLTLPELLNEQHYIDLGQHATLVWKIAKWKSQVVPYTQTHCEHSINRLALLLESGHPPTGNAIYEKLSSAILSQQPSIQINTALAEISCLLSPNQTALISQVLKGIVYYLYSTGRCPAALQTLKSAVNGITLQTNTHTLIDEALQRNKLGPIVFVTPEMGRFSTVGGIGVVVDELSQCLASFGCSVYVISPYYNYFRGKTGYLAKEGISWVRNLHINLTDTTAEIGVHKGVEKDVQLFFLHNYTFFPVPYPQFTSTETLMSAALMCQGALELLCQLSIIPSIIVTNDWFTGLTPAFASHCFGTTFNQTLFFHLVHNLEEGYTGKLYDARSNCLQNLPTSCYQDGRNCIDLSMCAFKSCDSWGTVSQSYKQDLLSTSGLRFLLSKFPHPFACSNGIRSKERIKLLLNITPTLDHNEAKACLQRKYFGFADLTIPVFSFVGRICEQKGVANIAHVAQQLIIEYKGEIMFIVGGMAPRQDPYAAAAADSLNWLRHNYPKSLWAAPDSFFTDGPLLNIGSNFALMPSKYEPSGVVQQEFFLGGTPVIAFKTGGLRDTVFEFDYDTGKGNGITFEAHTDDDFRLAIIRALKLYRNTEKYWMCRANARSSVLDMDEVAARWTNEFCRLKRCIFDKYDT
ncbi:glycosyl group 1 family protein [Pelomyxa schiedti]|nr:glycosyl group 1 family protein [Pelomyxa schiedti]